MSLSQKQVAYYHLPGLFEFYELYSVFRLIGQNVLIKTAVTLVNTGDTAV